MAKIEETALSRVEEDSGEVQASSLSAAATREVECRVMLAKRFPREEDVCFRKLAQSLKRPEFAALAYYEMPAFGKKGKPVPVRSVHLAREFMRCWGNMTSGLMIVAEDETASTLRGFGWDLESNTYRSEDISVPKLVQKRIYDEAGEYQQTVWKTADPGEFRRLCANMGARPERNCIFRIIGAHYVDAAVGIAKATILEAATKDLPKATKGLLLGFERLGISLGELELYLKCAISAATAEQITELEGIGRAIKAGEAKWADYQNGPAPVKVDIGDFKPSADPNRGHDQTQPPQELLLSEAQRHDIVTIAVDNKRTPRQIEEAALVATYGRGAALADCPASAYDFLSKALGPQAATADAKPHRRRAETPATGKPPLTDGEAEAIFQKRVAQALQKPVREPGEDWS